MCLSLSGTEPPNVPRLCINCGGLVCKAFVQGGSFLYDWGTDPAAKRALGRSMSSLGTKWICLTSLSSYSLLIQSIQHCGLSSP